MLTWILANIQAILRHLSFSRSLGSTLTTHPYRSAGDKKQPTRRELKAQREAERRMLEQFLQTQIAEGGYRPAKETAAKLGRRLKRKELLAIYQVVLQEACAMHVYDGPIIDDLMDLCYVLGLPSPPHELAASVLQAEVGRQQEYLRRKRGMR
ncbi:MAG: hypothetical protein WC551_00120 [Patescibacteria group bacterium]